MGGESAGGTGESGECEGGTGEPSWSAGSTRSQSPSPMLSAFGLPGVLTRFGPVGALAAEDAGSTEALVVEDPTLADLALL